MTATAFIDTNVLLYAASNAPADQAKRTIARQILSLPEISFSAQVLQEFYAAAVTKHRLAMNHDEIITDKRSGITSDPNNPDDEECIVRLVGQVIRVSVETVKIVSGLPAEYT